MAAPRRRNLGLLSVVLSLGQAASLEMPFAATALWVSQLSSLRRCEDAQLDHESASCRDPESAVSAWHYALANLNRALDGAVIKPDHVEDAVGKLYDMMDGYLQGPSQKRYSRLMRQFRDTFTNEDMRAWLSRQGNTNVDPDEDPVILRGRAVLNSTSDPGLSLSMPVVNQLTSVEARAERFRNATRWLANGNEMPLVGFGTRRLNGERCSNAVNWALESGYRHIDTSQSYENEAEVGRAILESRISRKDIFLTTKISKAEIGHFHEVLDNQLNDLNVSYVDVYMLENPQPLKVMRAAWKELEKLHEEGKVKSLGVANVQRAELASLIEHARIKPVYLQNKFSVYSHGLEDGSSDLFPLLRKYSIALVGYSVVNPYPGVLPPLQDPHVLAVAKRYNVTASQVLHRWALQLGVAVLTKSWQRERIQKNSQLFGFNLRSLDMELLSGLVELATVATQDDADDEEEEEETNEEAGDTLHSEDAENGEALTSENLKDVTANLERFMKTFEL